MQKEYVKQHFIPQCYLKNFSENGKFVFVYSKKNKNKGYPQSIAKIAYQDNFYTIPENYINQELLNEIDGNFIEKRVLSERIESLYSGLLNKIIRAASTWTSHNESIEIFSTKERDLFAALIAIQYLRMPNIRDKYWHANRKIQKERNEILSAMKRIYGDIDCSEVLALHREDDYAPVLHSEIFLDEKLIADIQDKLVKKIWKYKIAPSDTVFTSDNPILLKPHLKNQAPFYEGFAMKGVEVIFPVSESIILTIWDEETFIDSKAENNTFSFLTDAELRHYNCYQYIWANDEVYSSKNDFKLINLLKIANGDINTEITIERPTIKVNGK
ncbi:DUF4238 domain-containing protein [Spirosoma montaniterrae]|uniref:DUF4238 domain-containing protein n=1 Tax=Spirosoma montaniterrae TaxID=1178516 RepID=A0A1P9WTG5_9BACT|nr:DUF4238 domain-containing protein [Spirosoma montaniterrae]AQG78662.1 hypothetical protein AWR27_04520 [Spirosoma montaniterrae]